MSAYETFLKKYGSPDDGSSIDEGELKSIGEALPENLVEFFRKHGTAAYDNGLFRTVSPARCAAFADAWGEPQAENSIFLIGAFGCFAYHHSGCNYFVNVWAGTKTELFPDPADVFDASLCDAGFIKNILLRPDFLKIVKRLGSPADDECYGFFPAIALGGDGSPESVRKVKLREHLALLSQL